MSFFDHPTLLSTQWSCLPFVPTRIFELDIYLDLQHQDELICWKRLKPHHRPTSSPSSLWRFKNSILWYGYSLFLWYTIVVESQAYLPCSTFLMHSVEVVWTRCFDGAKPHLHVVRSSSNRGQAMASSSSVVGSCTTYDTSKGFSTSLKLKLHCPPAAFRST